MVDKKEKDEVTGVETTGHEWDGIKELNNPAPRWWLWILYVTIIWSVGYWVIYPSWPTMSENNFRGGTIGSAEENQYTDLKKSQAAIHARKASYLKHFHGASFNAIANNPELYAFAIAGGKAAFKDNCATCHGTGGAGGPGYPNLNDDDWIWGGSPDEIYETIQYGIRNTYDDCRSSEMPAFGDMLGEEETEAVVDLVLSLSGNGSGSAEGAQIFADNCASCHGEDGRGMREFGAPNLADTIWLKSNGNREAIISQINAPKHGSMPAWLDRLDDDTIRQLTVYVHSLGGGE